MITSHHLHLHLAVSLLTILTYYFRNFHLLCSNIYLSGEETLIDKRRRKVNTLCIKYRVPQRRQSLSVSFALFFVFYLRRNIPVDGLRYGTWSESESESERLDICRPASAPVCYDRPIAAHMI